jgi:iron(III) transport system substrate-binding protein
MYRPRGIPTRRRAPRLVALLAALALADTAGAAERPGHHAAERVVSVYSARHYRSDEALYAAFTVRTGIRVNRVDGKEDELLEQLRSEGASGPADVFITVDAARIGHADALGLFQPLHSRVLASRIPARLRTSRWAAFSTRARVIVYAKGAVDPALIRNYEDLAAPALKGKVCARSGLHPYNLSLGAALLAHLGEARTEEWARGVVANLARPPRGTDGDQLRALVAGECQVALANTYYVARLMRSHRADDREAAAKLGVVWPDQQSFGAHVNVSAGGILRSARHPAEALAFLEYLASDEAQAHFAEGNEWPAVRTVRVRNAILDGFGPFKADPLDVEALTRNTLATWKIFERAGWR